MTVFIFPILHNVEDNSDWLKKTEMSETSSWRGR